jgi:hypothetical protein
MLKYIRASSDLPWLLIGDFNEVLHPEEHWGVTERSMSQMLGFRDMVDVNGLCDLGFEGRPWTFEKRVAGGSFCRVRLDRALATPDWCARFPNASVQHLSAACSDHSPILLRFSGSRMIGRWGKENKPFRYELMWEKHPRFVDMVEQVWKMGSACLVRELIK